jgi:hypothetical protein
MRNMLRVYVEMAFIGVCFQMVAGIILLAIVLIGVAVTHVR